MKGRLQITGVKTLQVNLKRLAKEYDKEFWLALQREAYGLLKDTIPLIPVDTGKLQSTARVKVEPNEISVIVGGIGKTKDYAIVQHEHLEFNHPKSGQAKYLEQPFLARLPKIESNVAGYIKRKVK